MSASKKIPVTVITGFLGAGKTTLINDILKNNPETKFALIENEFGDVAIDTKLIKGVEASQMFELKNGCICCTISNEFELTLAELVKKFPEVDHLLIETTGIAEPGPVIRPFFADENLKNLFHFNGTVCLVDAKHYRNYQAKTIAEKQIAVADVLIASKGESFSDQEKTQLQGHLKTNNPFATLFFSDYGVVRDFRIENIWQAKARFTNIDTKAEERLQVQTFRFGRSLNKTEFEEQLAYIFDLYKTEIYRVKGILCFEDEPYHFLLQGVGGSFELTESDELAIGTVSEIVIIGNLTNVDLTIFNPE